MVSLADEAKISVACWVREKTALRTNEGQACIAGRCSVGSCYL